MSEREFYLARLYTRPGGWRITILELMNFSSGANFSLLAIGWDNKNGVKVTVGRGEGCE